MQRSFRHRTIIQAVTGAGAVTVGALCDLTSASAVTIRRDLVELAEQGLVRRTRGGAARPVARGAPMPFAVRFETDHERKDALAAVVAELISDDESLILDNGTTCYAVARQLVGRPLTTLALSLHSAAALASRPEGTVIVPGGPVENDTLAFTGSTAVDAIRDTRADVVVIGACAASPDHGLTSTTFDDARIKQACLVSGTRRILVTTADKLTHTSTFRFGSPGDLTQLVTTADAPEYLLEIFRAEGVDVRTVPLDVDHIAV